MAENNVKNVDEFLLLFIYKNTSKIEWIAGSFFFIVFICSLIKFIISPNITYEIFMILNVL